MSGKLVRLPDEADGARRFAIVGRYLKAMGATDAYQRSIWRWSGRIAKPLLVYRLAQMADDPVISGVADGALKLHEKAGFKRLLACGACSGRQRETTFDLLPRGVRRAGTRSLTPEIDMIDDLYDRRFRAFPAADLASPSVLSTLTPIVQKALQDARTDKLDPILGLLMRWSLAREAGLSTVCLSADEIGFPQIFTIDARSAVTITAVRQGSANACDGAGAQS